MSSGFTLRMTTVVVNHRCCRLALVPLEVVADPVDPDQLVGATEIAERLGVDRKTVSQWRQRGTDGFPAPVATLRQANVWAWPDVEAWARSTGRLR